MPESTAFSLLFDDMERTVIGGREPAMLLMCALLARGHILIEDVPGVGKTLLARTFAQALGLSFGRVQCTPDVLPGDILGFSLYDVRTGQANFRPGAVMHQLLLVDEINRASPKTQSCLLEAMEERQSTVDGVTRPLPAPFMVIATQNPIESVGTSPLPEAQLDRFLIRMSLGYPSAQDETELLMRFRDGIRMPEPEKRFDAQRLLALQEQADRVTVSRATADYITGICRRTRQHSQIELGVSPRGALALMKAAQALSLTVGLDYVKPEAVRLLAVPVLAHRLILRGAEPGRENGRQRELIEEIVDGLAVPVR